MTEKRGFNEPIDPTAPEEVADGADQHALVELRDRSRVLIRQVRPEDAPLLEDGFLRLSAASRRLRFLTEKARLSPNEVRYFTHIDHHDHEAIGARDAADGRGVGIVRFIRDRANPQSAEVAVAVVDEWQRRGVATELLSRLMVRAREEGIHHFTALVAEENEAVPVLLRDLGAEFTVVNREPGFVTYEIWLAPNGRGGELQRMLRAFGRGDLRVPRAVLEVLAGIVPEKFQP